MGQAFQALDWHPVATLQLQSDGGEYATRFYLPASRQGELYARTATQNAKNISAWKSKIRAAWQSIEIRRLDTPKKHIQFGDKVRFDVALKLNGLAPEDVVVELMMRRPTRKEMRDYLHFRFSSQASWKEPVNICSPSIWPPIGVDILITKSGFTLAGAPDSSAGDGLMVWL